MTVCSTECYALAMGLALRTTAENPRGASEGFPWERQDGESVQAFARFLCYRDIDPRERSHRKVASICEISETLVNRWGKRWQWTKRAVAYDTWLLQLGDELGKRAQLSHRAKLVRFSSLSIDKASATVAKLSEAKLSANEAIDLAVNGAKLGRQALELADGGQTVAERAPNASVSVSFNSAWVTKQEETGRSEVVPIGEQVLAEIPATPVRTVATKTIDKLPQRQLPSTKRLAERIVTAPKATPSTKLRGAEAGAKRQTPGGDTSV